MMNIDQNKFNRQIKGIERWRSAKNLGIGHENGVGILWYVTGMGKTFTACYIIKTLMEKNNGNIVYILVPSERLEIQWTAELLKFVPSYISNIKVLTAQKLLNLNCQVHCNLLIVDEIHEFYSEERMGILDGSIVICKYKLGLTATFKDPKRNYKKVEGFLPVVDRIDEEEALREGWISKYIEYNLGVNLTDYELKVYKEYSDIINKNLNKFGKGNALELAGKCLSGDGKYKGMDYCWALASKNGFVRGMDMTRPVNQEIAKIWSPDKIMGYAKALMNAIRERKNILYSAHNKFIVRDIVDKYDTLKFITFSQSTDFADKVGFVINNNKEKPICGVYHSQLKTKIVYDEVKKKEVKRGKTVLKREVIEGVKKGVLRGISTSSSLDRGLDIQDISLVVTTSGTQNPNQYDQRKGRGLRIDYLNKDAIVLIVNIYVKNTQDQKWLEKRQSETKNIIYWVDKVSDINYSPVKNNTFNIDEI